MTILNTTFVLDKEIEEEVCRWIERTYRAAAEKMTGRSTGNHLLRILEAPAPTPSYALQLCFEDTETAAGWNDGVGARLRAIMRDRWGERAVAFTTTLEKVV